MPRQCLLTIFIILSVNSLLSEDLPKQELVKNESTTEKLNETESTVIDVINDYQARCEKQDWLIWNHSLCGPLLFVEPKTRKLYASQSDNENILVLKNGLYQGYLPQNETVANTAKDWAGIRWTMLMLPLPKELSIRRSLLTHESWHRIQPSLELLQSESNNAHLSKLEPKTLMLLELKALAKALEGHSEAELHALYFRERRYHLVPDAYENERLLEMNEGLAEYTGMSLNTSKVLINTLHKELINADKRQSLERSFAYLSGPAYGLIIEKKADSRDWVKSITKDFSFSRFLSNQLKDNYTSPTDEVYQKVFTLYGGHEVLKKEEEKIALYNAKINDLKARLVTGPTLHLPLHRMQMNFNPNLVQNLEEFGTVYQTMTLIDQWGKIEAKNGLLMSPNYKHAYVEARSLKSTDWQLQLNDGWQITETEKGYSLTQDK